jgi:pseudouridine kinase
MSSHLVVCIGAALIDETFRLEETPVPGTSNPASRTMSAGGVAKNVAGYLASLGQPVQLVAAFGDDSEGSWLREQCRLNGIGIDQVLTTSSPTGKYVALLSPAGDLFAGAVAGNFGRELTPEVLHERIPLLKKASLIVFDCNLEKESMEWLLRFCRQEKIPCVVEPVSIPKVRRLHGVDLQGVLLVTPNLRELSALTEALTAKDSGSMALEIIGRGANFVWIRDGINGSEIYGSDLHIRMPAPRVNVIDTSGAGDAALAGWVYAWLRKRTPRDCVRYGHGLASLVLKEKGTVIHNLNREILENAIETM